MSQKTEMKYQLHDILQYQDKNRTMPPNLIPYCYNTNRQFLPASIALYHDIMSELVSQYINGDTLSDTEFKKNIKKCINTINNENYRKTIDTLMTLNYTSKENIQFVVHELIVCAIRCPIGVKGNRDHDDTDGTRSLSELCGNLAKYLSCNITVTSHKISFQEELLKMCYKFFFDFINLSKSMNENNETTADNYKGFMTFMGYIYRDGLIVTDIIIECIEYIQRTIFNSMIEYKTEKISNQITQYHEKMFGFKKTFDEKLYNSIIYYDTHTECLGNRAHDITDIERYTCYRNLTECTNYYKGYDNLMHYVIIGLRNKFTNLSENKENIDEDDYNKSVAILHSYINKIVELHQRFTDLNKLYKIKTRNGYGPPLKPHTMILHNESGALLNKVIDDFYTTAIKYKAASKQ